MRQVSVGHEIKSETEHSTDLRAILNEAGHRIKSETEYSSDLRIILNEVGAGHMIKSEVG